MGSYSKSHAFAAATVTDTGSRRLRWCQPISGTGTDRGIDQSATPDHEPEIFLQDLDPDEARRLVNIARTTKDQVGCAARGWRCPPRKEQTVRERIEEEVEVRAGLIPYQSVGQFRDGVEREVPSAPVSISRTPVDLIMPHGL
jgi:hypothetical protein